MDSTTTVIRRPRLVARCHQGRVRRRNEDAVAVDEDNGLAVLADGMGGLLAGDVASGETVATVMAYLRRLPGAPRRRDLVEALQAANRRVRSVSSGGLMGSTALALWLGPGGEGCIGHVGDSRAYRWRDGVLEALTRDHSLVQEMVEQGLLAPERARTASERNVITRAVGLEDEVEVDTLEVDLAPGEMLLLCSDGLWDMLEDADIGALLAACQGGREALVRCAEALVEAANAAGGHDNISVVLARF